LAFREGWLAAVAVHFAGQKLLHSGCFEAERLGPTAINASIDSKIAPAGS